MKLECLRLLATLRLDPAKARLISSFIDTYLNLRGDERRLFARELQAMPAREREDVMELTTSWKEEGRVEGREEGRQEGREEGRHHEATRMILRLIQRRFREVPVLLVARIETLSLDRLEALAEDLLDFVALADLERWLSHRPQA